MIGVNLAYLVGSTVIIENVFALPGLGQLLASPINTRDLSVVQEIQLLPPGNLSLRPAENLAPEQWVHLVPLAFD